MCNCPPYHLFSYKPFINRQALARSYDLIPLDITEEETFYRIKACDLRSQGQAIGRLLLHLQRILDVDNFENLQPVINYYRRKAQTITTQVLEITFHIALLGDNV